MVSPSIPGGGLFPVTASASGQHSASVTANKPPPHPAHSTRVLWGEMASEGAVEMGMTWEEDLVRLVADTGIHYRYTAGAGDDHPPVTAVEAGLHDVPVVGTGKVFGVFEDGPGAAEESLKDQMKGFLKASGELLLELGKSCRDIMQQSLVGAEDTVVVKKLRTACGVASARLEFLNEYLPEDRDPAHAWPVVIVVFLLALTALSVSTERQPPKEVPKKMYVQIHPPSASHIQLTDGRNLAYREQGVPVESARFSMIVPHSFLSSRLAGIPGIKESLLEEFGVHLVTYDLPGFGESDPHSSRNLNSSAQDMLYLANTLGIREKFWVLGYSGAGMHVWAALRHIPSNVAGAAMFAPMVNPYEASMTKEEKYKTWEKWNSKRKFLYVLARKFPSFLPYFYRRSFLSGKHGEPGRLLSLSLGKKDKALMGEPIFKEFWERDVEESVRQGDTRPFVEEAVLQVSNWGFSLADLQVQKKHEGKGLLMWLKGLYTHAEREWAGFLGPIHIWQGMDDQVVPPSMAEFVRRVVPGATVHRLLGEGHFSYFWFCDECHRHIFSTLFGIPQGPLLTASENQTSSEVCMEETTDVHTI